jgi:hypothetical protein
MMCHYPQTAESAFYVGDGIDRTSYEGSTTTAFGLLAGLSEINFE